MANPVKVEVLQVGIFGQLREWFEMAALWVASKRVTTQVRVEFYRMTMLLHRNLGNLLEAMLEIEANYSDSGRKRFNPVAMIARECARTVEDGDRLSSVLLHWFPEEEVMLIAAGEAAGNLQDGLNRAMSAVERADKVSRAVSKLVYPVILAAMIVYLLDQVTTTIVPQMTRMGDPSTWGFQGQILKALADFAKFSGLFGVAVPAGVIVAAVVSLPYWTGPLRIAFERFPPWSLYRDLRGATFLEQVTVLQGGGRRLEEALQILRELASPWLVERIDAVNEGVQEGLTLGEALYASDMNFPSPAAVRFLRTITGKEGSGENVEAFAKDWSNYVVERVEKLTGHLTTAGIFVFYGILFMVFSTMNQITNAVMSSMGGM